MDALLCSHSLVVWKNVNKFSYQRSENVLCILVVSAFPESNGTPTFETVLPAQRRMVSLVSQQISYYLTLLNVPLANKMNHSLVHKYLNF